MLHLFDICVQNWNLYWGSKWILLLLAACILFLLTRERKNTAAMLTLGSLLILISVYFFPFSASVIRRSIGKRVLWRVLWVIPLFPLLALGLTSMVRSAKWKVVRILIAAAGCAAIIATGQNALSTENYRKLSNEEQIPDVVVSIGQQIQSRSDGREVLVAADDYVASYLRIYDPSIKMIYGRYHSGALSNNAIWIYKYINTWPYTDYRRLRRRARLEGLDFIIMQEPSEEGREILSRGGYQVVSAAGDYVILQRQRKSKQN